jgi:hypothetical protein
MKKLFTLIIVAVLLIGTAQTAEAKPKRPKSGYNYKAHHKKSTKYKRENERGKKRKCGRQ